MKSRAGSHFFYTEDPEYLGERSVLHRPLTEQQHERVLNTRETNVGGGLLPKALCQSLDTQRLHRNREQAPSHIGYSPGPADQ